MCDLCIGFPANETFCEKMRKFSFALCKLFRESKLSVNKAKYCKKNFRENAKYENDVGYTTFHFSQTLPLLFTLFSESQTLPLILGKLVIWKQKKMVRNHD